MTNPESDGPLLLLTNFLKSGSVLAWISLLASHNSLKVLVYSSKSISSYVRRKRKRQAETNPPFHPSQDLDFVESWATDFLKLFGKFGQNLSYNPDAIYQQIPPFCPKSSMLYRQFQQQNTRPHSLTVGGISKPKWDDSLARLSLGSGAHALAVLCSGAHIAALTAVGNILLYNAETFEIKRTLAHGERVCTMNFSSCSNLVVTYGFRTTKVWSVNTGQIMHEIRNPPGSRAFSITFSAGRTELAAGSSDRLIRIARLTDPEPTWSVLSPGLLIDNTTVDRPAHNVPWRIAFNADASHVAVAYRGLPLSVWQIDPPELIGRCMRSKDIAGNGWTVVDQVIWHPGSDEVIGLYMACKVFRWNPFTNTQQELHDDASVIASSPDGRFFATGDCHGTIKLYDFDQFTTVYQLSCEDMINDICFSPDGKRLYDVRGQFCNVWEPNTLLRADENPEQNSEVESEHASTLVISEASAELRDQITAVAIQFRGRYQAIGNHAGVVSVVDSLDDECIAVQLWKSPVELYITHLDWSSDDKYLACAELTGKVLVKKVQQHNSGWTVTSIFEVKLDISSEGIQDVLLNDDGTTLLVKNGPYVSVWPLREASGLKENEMSITSSDTVWMKHPTDPTLLLACAPNLIQVHRWDDLTEVHRLNVDELRPFSNPEPDDILCLEDKPKSTAKVHSIHPSSSGPQVLMDMIYKTTEGNHHRTILIEPPTINSSSAKVPSLIATIHEVPEEIQHQIQIPLGIMPTRRLIFLDKNDWICSYCLDANFDTEKPLKHYFFPKDWLNVECLQLCTLLADGKLLIPNNGELAVIKCTGI
jgi:WD40 repeat protein